MALNETLNLNITEAQRQISALESQLDQLSRPITVPVSVQGGGGLEQVRRDLDSSEGAVSELNRELDQTDDALRTVSREADRTGRDIETAGRKGNTAFGNLRTTVGALGGTLVAFAGASALGSFLSDSVTAASELEQSVGALDAVFGDLAGQVETFGETADQSVGLAASQFNQLASVLGSQLQTFGFSVEEAATQTQNLIVLASDLAATFGGPVSQAVEAISSLLRGETNPIERYGVAMNEASVQARALEDGLAASASELSFQDKTLARLSILMEQTANAQGQFGREAETTAGQMERLNAEWENTQAIVGGALVPALQAVLPIISQVAQGVGVIALELAGSVGLIDDASAQLQILAIQTGLAADSTLVLAGAIADFQDELGEAATDSNRASEGAEDFAESIENIVDQWAGSGRDAQEFLSNFDAIIESFGLTEESAESLRLALEQRIATEFATQEDAALLNNLARQIDNVGTAIDRTGPLASGFGRDLAQGADGAAIFSGLVDSIEDEFNRLPGIFGIVSDALEDAEGEAITSAADFLDNIRAEFDAQALFESNIEAARALGLDNLVSAAEEFGIEFAPVLADALANPTLAAEIDAEFDTFMGMRAENAHQSLVTKLLAEFSGAPLEVILDVDVKLGNVRLPGAGNLFENLNLGATGSVSVTGSGGGGTSGGNTIVNNYTGFTPTTTDVARTSQITNSIIRS